MLSTMSLVAFVLSFSTYAAADCSSFKNTTEYFTKLGATLPASPVLTCNNGTGGNVEQGGTYGSCNAPGSCLYNVDANLNLQGSTNQSLTLDEAASLYGLLPAHITPVRQTYCDKATGASICFVNGQSIYTTFTPWLTCINGTLEGCSGGPVSSGTAIQICGIATNAMSPQLVDCVIAYKNVSSPSFQNGFVPKSMQCISGSARLSAASMLAVFVAGATAALMEGI